MNHTVFTSLPGEIRSIVMSMYVDCLPVCTHISPILRMLPVVVARSYSGGVAICHVLPVLWMTSRFHIMGPMARHVYTYNSTTVPPRPEVTIEH